MTDSDHADDTEEAGNTGGLDETEDPGWPWSFILLVVAGGIYLIFRFVDLAIKLFN